MRIIYNSKTSKKLKLEEFNNISDKPTEFMNFICILCRKYSMRIYKMVKTHSKDKNMGAQLISFNGYLNIFYNYNKNLIEIECSGKNSSLIENDIFEFVQKTKYLKGDKVLDGFGNIYIIDEPFELNDLNKKVNVTNIKDRKNYKLYISSIVPYIE